MPVQYSLLPFRPHKCTRKLFLTMKIGYAYTIHKKIATASHQWCQVWRKSGWPSLFLSPCLLSLPPIHFAEQGFRLTLAPAVLCNGACPIPVVHTRPRFFVRVGQIIAGLSSSAVKTGSGLQTAARTYHHHAQVEDSSACARCLNLAC